MSVGKKKICLCLKNIKWKCLLTYVCAIYIQWYIQNSVLVFPALSGHKKHRKVFGSLLPFHCSLSKFDRSQNGHILAFSLLAVEFRSSSQHHPDVLSLPRTSDLPCDSLKPIQCDGSDVKPFSHASTGLFRLLLTYYVKNPANLKEDEIQWGTQMNPPSTGDPRFTSS